MNTAAPAAAKRPQYDPARAAYQRSRNAEAWVREKVMQVQGRKVEPKKKGN